MSNRFYVTTAIPYVNGDPHLGFALELVQADVLARHRRLRGEDVRFLSGTDDNSLKNVVAAEVAGLPVAEFVREKAQRFAALRDVLSLSYDDFIRTSVDPRHAPGVERLWRACAAAGDLYERDYEGLYCTGCEAFVARSELVDGRCPEHGEPPERVAERNWFFRLSRYGDRLLAEIESGRLRITPEHRRNEVLSFVRGGLEDFSVSRSRERARGWGISVPGDPTQVVYVWFDALGNYITALDYGNRGERFRGWWEGADERVHVIGKGIIRFHAVYWPAILLSAGEPLPTTIAVHDYLTVEGQRISKSGATSAGPAALATRYGADALRWWLVRDVPRSGDVDFREEQLARRANELADGLGNLVNRTIALLGPDGVAPAPPPEEAAGLIAALGHVTDAIDESLAVADYRSAADALWGVVAQANRFVSAARPWEADGERLDAILSVLLEACERIAHELHAFLPDAAARIEAALERRDPALGRSLFRKAEVAPRTRAGQARPLRPDLTAS